MLALTLFLLGVRSSHELRSFRFVLEVGTCFDVLIYPAFSRGPLPKETLSNVDLEGQENVIIIGNNCNRVQVRLGRE